MENTVRVLLAEQESEILSLLSLSLMEIKECELEICSLMNDLLKRVVETKPGLVLLNAARETEYVLSILQKIHESDPGIYVIVSLPEKFQHSTDSLMIAGAHDCVVKDRKYVPSIVSAVKKALIRIAEREAFEVPVLARAQRFAMDENLPDVIFSLDLSGKILYANHAVSSLLAYEQKEIVGRSFSNILAGESERHAFHEYLSAIDQNISLREVLMLKDRNGREKNFEINFTLMEGEIIYGVARRRTSIRAQEEEEVEEEVPVEAIPARLGPYRIVTLLGAGAMGRVYKGFDEQLERFVAIKVISKSLAENERYVERFRREAKILASISHPNIALIYYFASLEGLPYFCMEFLPNGSLESLLQANKAIDPLVALSYVIQVASGLREALSKGVLHMDIKPSNLMLAEDGRLKVVDFGLAQTSRDMSELEKNIVGTPVYIAPEQIMGGVADFRMDIYSLGITFFEMLYGFVPFSGPTVSDIFHTKLRGALPSRSELNQSVPAKLYDIVIRMIERDPLQRINSYSELLEELESVRRIGVQVEAIPEIEKPETSTVTMRGLLYDHPLPEVLGQIAQQQLNGKLTINWGQLFKQLHFKEGKLVALLSNQEGEDFIDLVISRLPAEAKMMRKLQISKSSDLYHGYSTVVEKLPADLRARLSEDLLAHAEKIIQNLFTWMTGEFIFESGDFPGQLDLEISLHDTITNGVRKWLDYEFIRKKLFEGNCLIRHDPEFIRHLRNLNLEPSDRFLLFRFEEEIDYGKLYEISGISQEEFGRLIYLFRCFGLIHLQRTAGETKQKKPVEVPAAGSSGDLCTYYTHCAVKSFEEKNYWSCVEYCRKALAHRQDASVYRLMGRALATHPPLRHEAVDAYKQALVLAPGNVGIERDLADLYFDLGDKVQAKSKYESILKLNPADQHAAKRLQEVNRQAAKGAN
ncbi:protein kinase [bacterium]|nr:protein kinase [bacterium]MCI0602773.1 protein kinase [bacterium]